MKSLGYAKKFLKSYLHEISPTEIVLTLEELKIKDQIRDSFYEFVKYMWGSLNIDPYKDNWHIQALCEHLEASYRGEIRNLIINLPPRMAKSIITSILFPAWCWTNDPKKRFLYSSYTDSLIKRDALAFRSFLESGKFNKFWGHEIYFPSGKRGLNFMQNNMYGYRYGAPAGGAITGHGADILIVDDPNDINKSESLVIRTKVNNWFDYTLPTRVHNPNEVSFIVVQQRAHCLDVSGHILSKKNHGYVHLFLPMEYEKNRKCITVPLKSTKGKPWQDPRTEEGELLFEEHYNFEALQKLKRSFNNDTYRIAGQLQQRPTPSGGGIILTSWFNKWQDPELPTFELILQSWDTALTTGVDSSFSACTTWGVFQIDGIYQIMLLSLFKDKLEYPNLRKMIYRLANNYMDTDFENPIGGSRIVDTVIIESKGSGYGLLADIRSQPWNKNIMLLGFDPTKDAEINSRRGYSKVGRARLVTHLMEAGQVWVQTTKKDPERLTEFSQVFLNACELFPSSDSNDIIDTMSQALIVLTKNGYIYNKDDDQPIYDDPVDEIIKKQTKRYY